MRVTRTTRKHWRSPSTPRPRSTRVNTRGGEKCRSDAAGATPKGLDHDPPPKRKWTPLGILMLTSGALTLIFCQRETSDSWADGLLLWWESIKARMRHIKRLVIYLDNGPK